MLERYFSTPVTLHLEPDVDGEASGEFAAHAAIIEKTEDVAGEYGTTKSTTVFLLLSNTPPRAGGAIIITDKYYSIRAVKACPGLGGHRNIYRCISC